jgi:hypothetical protein
LHYSKNSENSPSPSRVTFMPYLIERNSIRNFSEKRS